MTIPAKWLKLAGDMLERAADHLGNAGSNDWKWPADWTDAERREFAASLVRGNLGRDDPHEVEDLVRYEFGPPDWWVCSHLAKVLRGEVPS